MNERDIYTAAVQIDDPAAQVAWLDQACAGDEALHARINKLLTIRPQVGSFMDHLAVEATNLEGGEGAGELVLPRYLKT